MHLRFTFTPWLPLPVQNKPLVKKVLLLVAHGLDCALWESGVGQRALSAWRRCLGEPVPLQARNATLAPGGREAGWVG